MAITRSRTIPKVVKKEQPHHDINQKKMTEKEGKKVIKPIKSLKSNNIKISKVNNSFPKKVPKRQIERKLKKDDSDKLSSPNTDDRSDSQIKKLPAYKIEQLQRLQRLIDMSEVARPRGPITLKDFKSKKTDDSTSINVILDKSNKNKISNVTSYNPIRQKLLENKLTHDEKKKVTDKYDKLSKYKNVKVPSLSEDLILKEVLNEISEKNADARFWNYYGKQIGGDLFGNPELSMNEKNLNLLEISEAQRENLMNQKLNNVESLYAANDDIDKGNEFKRMDINKATNHTDLNNILKNLNSNLDTKVNEDIAFDGLKLEDYTTVRNFGNSKV